MNITLEIPNERIANIMISFIESHDPVTMAWVRDVNLLEGGEAHDGWYADPALYAGRFLLAINEYDESTDAELTHKIGPVEVAVGLRKMAEKYPSRFGQVMRDDTDAPCADLFMQCVLFGEEKYA